MSAPAMPLEEIRRLGLEALQRELGPVGCLRALPIDSLCPRPYCRAIMIDTAVRMTPSSASLRIEGLQYIFSFSAIQLRARWDESIALSFAPYPEHRPVGADTAALGVALVTSNESASMQRVVLATL